MAQMVLLKYEASLEQDAVQRLQRIQKNAETECELISELLELSRIKARRGKIEPVDLHALVCELQGQFASDLEKGRISLRLHGHLPTIRGEKNRLRQVFQNLIDNAIKYIRPDGPRAVTISAAPAENEVVVSVSDTGIGVAEDDLPQLFHVFRRARSALTAKIPGKGVGLASVKSIVENHEGRLWAQSTLGEGTTIYVAFPRQAVVAEPAPSAAR
jgi:signal transduction histidine kinase